MSRSILAESRREAIALPGEGGAGFCLQMMTFTGQIWIKSPGDSGNGRVG
ncbi:hypothetical protein NG791_21960 [Laspinema sp. D1]|nr:hypothetical protein [Laspinema sp. D2b]